MIKSREFTEAPDRLLCNLFIKTGRVASVVKGHSGPHASQEEALEIASFAVILCGGQTVDNPHSQLGISFLTPTEGVLSSARDWKRQSSLPGGSCCILSSCS